MFLVQLADEEVEVNIFPELILQRGELVLVIGGLLRLVRFLLEFFDRFLEVGALLESLFVEAGLSEGLRVVRFLPALGQIPNFLLVIGLLRLNLLLRSLALKGAFEYLFLLDGVSLKDLVLLDCVAHVVNVAKLFIPAFLLTSVDRSRRALSKNVASLHTALVGLSWPRFGRSLRRFSILGINLISVHLFGDIAGIKVRFLDMRMLFVLPSGEALAPSFFVILLADHLGELRVLLNSEGLVIELPLCRNALVGLRNSVLGLGVAAAELGFLFILALVLHEGDNLFGLEKKFPVDEHFLRAFFLLGLI